MISSGLRPLTSPPPEGRARGLGLGRGRALLVLLVLLGGGVALRSSPAFFRRGASALLRSESEVLRRRRRARTVRLPSSSEPPPLLASRRCGPNEPAGPVSEGDWVGAAVAIAGSGKPVNGRIFFMKAPHTSGLWPLFGHQCQIGHKSIPITQQHDDLVVYHLLHPGFHIPGVVLLEEPTDLV